MEPKKYTLQEICDMFAVIGISYTVEYLQKLMEEFEILKMEDSNVKSEFFYKK